MFKDRPKYLRLKQKRRMAQQDNGTDPFEINGGNWEDLDHFADNFEWATAPVSP